MGTFLEFITRNSWQIVALLALVLFVNPIKNFIMRLRRLHKNQSGIVLEFQRETGIEGISELSIMLDRKLQLHLLRKQVEHTINLNPTLKALSLWDALEDRIKTAINYTRPKDIVVTEKVRSDFFIKLKINSDLKQEFNALREIRNSIYISIDEKSNNYPAEQIIQWSAKDANIFSQRCIDFVTEFDGYLSKNSRYKDMLAGFKEYSEFAPPQKNGH